MRDRSGSAFYTGLRGLSDARPITSTVGATLMTVGGVIAMVPAVGPLIGGIVAGVGALTSLIGGLFKPDVTKIEASRIVDQIEAEYLKPNLAKWESLPREQKTPQVQQAFLSIVDQALDGVQKGCSNPALGEAGQRCISERLVKGGTAPWCPSGSGCDWISLYRDPIANDPDVTDSISSELGIDLSSVLPSGVSNIPWVPLALIAGLALMAADL